MFYRLRLFLAFLIMAIWSGCDDNYVSSIPSYPVGLQLNLTSTYSTFKNSTNQFLLFEKRINETDRIGFGGILVYSDVDLDDSGNTIYHAFDMACPYEHDADIVLKSDGYFLYCPKCGTHYDVAWGVGSPDSKTGPGTERLKKYTVSHISNYTYRVTN